MCEDTLSLHILLCNAGISAFLMGDRKCSGYEVRTYECLDEKKKTVRHSAFFSVVTSKPGMEIIIQQDKENDPYD